MNSSGNLLLYFSCCFFVDASKRKRRRDKCSSSIGAKRRRSSESSKENKIPGDDLNETDGEDLLASYISTTDWTEFESSQDSAWEESETVLQDRQANSNENKAGSEKERALLDVEMTADEKESVRLPELSDLRKESDVSAGQNADGSGEKEANGT